MGRSGEHNCIRDPEQLLENANALISYYFYHCGIVFIKSRGIWRHFAFLILVSNPSQVHPFLMIHISNGNGTDWSPIWSVIIRVINKIR